MDRAEIFEKLTEIFRDVFDDESIAVGEETTAADIEGWDSLTYIVLLSAIEDEFDIEFAMDSVQELKNVGKMVDVIQKRKENSATQDI